MKLDESSIYHVLNEHENARVRRILKEATFYVCDATASTLWLSLVAIHPRLFGSGFRVLRAPRSMNCHSWSLRFADGWFDPSGSALECIWPDGVANAHLVECYVEAFAHHGFAPCGRGDDSAGFERVALWSNDGIYCSHSAREETAGCWSSKLGSSPFVIDAHPLDGLSRKVYGEPVAFLRRKTR